MTSKHLLPALSVLLAAPGVARAQTPAPGPPRWYWTLAAQTRPVGLLARVDVRSSRAAAAVGVHVSYKTVSVEFGAGPSLYLLGGFLTLTARAVVEPGYFLAVRPGATLDEGRALEDPAGRVAGARYGGSALATLNLRAGRWWLYNRTTAWALARIAPEYDRVSDTVVDDELGLEVATAVMFDVAPRGTRRAWVYVEHTHAWLAGFGTTVARPSVGVILEELLPGVALDVDLNWGLREGPLQGPGVIVAAWITGD